jgi:hypothetical protein
MLRSRLFSTIYQPLIQRTIVTNIKSVINNDEQQPPRNSTEEHQAVNVSYGPPRRPLTQQFTHQVTNQVPPLEYVDLYESDLALQEFLTKENSGQMREMASELGVFHWFEQGQRANRYPPSLHQFDRYGQRIDEVQFHPSYHDLMQIGMRYGVSYSTIYCRNDCIFNRFIQLLGNHYQEIKVNLIHMDIYNML